jgi:hypothetical protein
MRPNRKADDDDDKDEVHRAHAFTTKVQWKFQLTVNSVQENTKEKTEQMLT